MQAIIHHRFGAPREVLGLGEAEVPVAGPDEILVRVKAVAVAKGDWLTARGWPLIARPTYGIRTPKHHIAGLEFSGVVEKAGERTTRFRPGDEVFGWGERLMAELAALPEEQLAPKPAAATFEQAAAIPVSGFAALQAVRDRAGVRPGQSVLVLREGSGRTARRRPRHPGTAQSLRPGQGAGPSSRPDARRPAPPDAVSWGTAVFPTPTE